MSLCEQCSVLEANETPRWNEFAGMCLLWPSVAFVTLTFLFTCLTPVYQNFCEKSASFRIFLQRFVGMPDKRKVTSPKPQIFIQLLRVIAALAQCWIFARKTYTKGNWNSGYIADWELAISCFFVFTHLMERLSEGFQFRFWNPKALVDIFVIIPVFLPFSLDLHRVPVERQWLCLSYFRIITALGGFRNLQQLLRSRAREDTVLGRCILTVLRLTAMIVCMAGTMFALEVVGEIPGLEDSFITVQMGDLSIVQMIYWITTTVSTVGYGDFSPTTLPARITIIFFIFGGVIFFGSETAEIVDLFNDTEEGRGCYVNRWNWLFGFFSGRRVMRSHILITGNGCNMSSPLMETLLLETLMDDWNSDGPDLVFLSDKEYDFDLKAFVETELGPGQSSRVFFLRGSVLNARDLERAQVQTSRLCFVIPDYTAEDEVEEDSANLMMSLSMLRHSPKLRLRLMLLQPEGARRANRMGIPRERCFSAEEVKCALFAESTRIRGLITLLSGLLQAHTNFADQHLKYLNAAFPEHWRISYAESLRWNLGGFILKDCFSGRSFPAVLEEIYRESNGTVMLLAAVIGGRLVLNCSDVVSKNQVVVAMATSLKAMYRFGADSGTFEKDWASVFLRERSRRLEREAQQTLQVLKEQDSLDLLQLGRRRKHLTDGGAVHARSIFEVTGAEAFKLLDKNNDGRLDKEEFEEALQEQLASNSDSPDIEELRERPDLTLLLVRVWEGVWSEVICFLKYFMKGHQLHVGGGVGLSHPPIVVLSTSEAPRDLIEQWESKTCCFVKGDVLNTRNLTGAGIRNAASIISIGRKVLPKDSSMPDAALGDSDCVELCGAVDQALDANSRNRGQLQLFEFSFTQSVFLMSRIERNSLKQHSKTRVFISEGCDSSSEVQEQEVQSHDTYVDKEMLILNESFAAGQAFTLDFFGGLFGRIHRFPAAIEFLHAIVSPEEGQHKSRLWQTKCPLTWVDRSFGELVQALVTGNGGEAFGHFKGCSIPVALYRESRGRHLPDSCAGFNFTGPPMNTKLEEEDFITILGEMACENSGAAIKEAFGETRENTVAWPSIMWSFAKEDNFLESTRENFARTSLTPSAMNPWVLWLAFYMLKRGDASVSRGTAQFFGEKALLENEKRGATVLVKSKTAKCLVLDRESFDFLLGPLSDIIQGQRENKRAVPGADGGDICRGKIKRHDLQRVGLLGCGGFGTVELWEHKGTGETYALKGLSKGYIVKTGMQDSVMNEKNILMMTNSSFITKLWETYNGTQTLYFLLEPCLGGELYATYNRKGFHGSEKHCRYYAGGVVFAFEHLHARRIIYRDLKPENLLLTEIGHIKLTDMGLAKFVIGKTFTSCGTPDYFAPELIASTGHTNAVDWWTLGILIFELMNGHPPFESAYPMQIYAKVTKGISKVPFPSQCAGPCKSLIEGLLQQEPSQRLPMRPGGIKNLMNHKWFSDLDWESMRSLELPTPYKPVVKNKRDLANFSARKEDAPRQLEYIDPGTAWDKHFATSS
ncbi:unnamed protein product [Durusdinium trenchii]|uniref:cGMP-dependent protein kinase n=1 Tax=Durusdinium trenchii TaxID=1381693 RepID=A0ABP0PKS0_9DINO